MINVSSISYYYRCILALYDHNTHSTQVARGRPCFGKQQCREKHNVTHEIIRNFLHLGHGWKILLFFKYIQVYTGRALQTFYCVRYIRRQPIVWRTRFPVCRYYSIMNASTLFFHTHVFVCITKTKIMCAITRSYVHSIMIILL